MAAASCYLEDMLGGMDRQLAGFKDECNALAEQHQAWLAETLQTNTKRLQYQTNPVLECPRSHRRPAARGRRRPLAAVKEVSEDLEDKENSLNKSDTSKGNKRGLGARSVNPDPSGGEESVGSKRKSEGSAAESDSKRVKEDSDEEKQITKETSRDQLAEINAASEALKREEAAAAAAAAEDEAGDAEACTKDALIPEDISKMRVPELRKELSLLGLVTTGNKPVLQERLANYVTDFPGPQRTEYDNTDEAGALGDSERSSYSEKGAPLQIQAAVVVGAGAQTADEDSAEDEADDAPMEDDLVTDPPLDIATESTDETDGTEEGTKETAEAAVLRVTRLRVPELRAELRELGLADDGKRQDLLDRLAAHFTGSAEDVVQAAAVAQEPPANEPEEARGSLNAASKFEAALNAESTALFDTVGSFQEAEARAEMAPEVSEPEASPEHAEADDSESGGSVMPVVAPVGSAPPAEEAEVARASQMDASAEASAGGFQRILQWATPFLGAPPAEAAASEVVDDEGYAVCDELERKLEARSARKRTFGTPEATPSAVQQPAATTAETDMPGAAAATFRANISAAACAAAADDAPADASTVAQSPESLEAGAAAAESCEMSREDEFTTAEEPGAALVMDEPLPVAKAEEADEEAAAEVDRDVQSEHDTVEEQEVEAVPDDAADVSQLAAAAKSGNVKLGAVAVAKAQLDAKMDSKLPKQDERLAKIQKKREDQEAERKAKQEKERQRMEEVRRRREKQEEEVKRALAEKVRRKEEKDVEEMKKQEAGRKLAQAQTAPAAKGKAPLTAKSGAQARSEAGSATAAAASAVPAPKSALPPIPPGWTEHKTPEGRSYYYHAATKKSTWERPCAARPESADAAKQYPIQEERVSSDGESESEEDEAANKQLVPSWAQSSQLQPALIEQYSLDPDSVFDTALHDQTQVVDLTSIFGRGDNSRRFHRRASSGDWSKDRLLDSEQKQYKRARGFDA